MKANNEAADETHGEKCEKIDTLQSVITTELRQSGTPAVVNTFEERR